MLPLGHRTTEKISRLIAWHMSQIGASQLALSTITSEALWARSGRLQNVSSELFHLTDRRDGKYLLSPTHEEEITTLVARTVTSYKSLPLRLYQITRKYRDEFRPRHGVLRSREFIMKDLYTFDYSVEAALATYEQVSAAYRKFFEDLKLPVVVAKASSGDMGGDLSHEYHLSTSLGEDHVVSCNSCDYAINDELAETRLPDSQAAQSAKGLRVWRGISKDRKVMVNVWYPESSDPAGSEGAKQYSDDDINIYAVKSAVPELDASIDDPLPFWAAGLEPKQANAEPSPEGVHPRLVNLVDCRLPESVKEEISNISSGLPVWPEGIASELTKAIPSLTTSDNPNDPDKPMNLLRIVEGDSCPRCDSGKLKVQRAIELGHTFYLGTRYSIPLEANVSVPAKLLSQDADMSSDAGESSKTVPMQMGCHGIGVSRIIGAVADHLADSKGLNWPRAIAPYEVVIIPGPQADEAAATKVYDGLVSHRLDGSPIYHHLDVLLDDREGPLPWKMKDADLVGYPVIVLLGREWAASRRCEVQCRRLGVKEQVLVDKLPVYVQNLLDQL
ncbi:putative prolyl-trna synthetase protein [Phaeoacremonium minimum UCRPA7]|uniref:proline--tRNA ligase n=1 Tax=Phaeoacremonium minimum (strain UCR-PA7) TaxID=1286976 RepID=R8BBX9_PHAM7|nr:putative prolyl-trna synthetase protein [Phaeoacremonium minimum UCRPA7]EON96807.1 putative prolyl-trna synthetase protein [Phaeoacremonium minimum UCRPA7]